MALFKDKRMKNLKDKKMKTKNKNSFRFKILGLLEYESEETSIVQVLIIAMIMAFIITIIVLLQSYEIPTIDTHMLINKLGNGIGKILKSRSP